MGRQRLKNVGISAMNESLTIVIGNHNDKEVVVLPLYDNTSTLNTW